MPRRPQGQTAEHQPGRLLSVAQVAEELGCDHRLVRQLITDRKLAAHRIGQKLIKVDRADLEAYLRSTRFRGYF